VDALAGVSVAFDTGRFATIMGPSGSGKSTLMHLLAGLDRPTSGSIVLDGATLNDLDDDDLTRLRRERVGFVFQTFNLLPVLHARENILLPLSIAGAKVDEEWFSMLIDTSASAIGTPTKPGCRSGAERAGDDHLLDLVGALADGEDLGVAVEAAHRVFLDVAIPAVDLHRLLGRAHGQAPGLELGLRRGEGEVASEILLARRLVDE
jgi:ABC-type sugar transport system ATPase subunit